MNEEATPLTKQERRELKKEQKRMEREAQNRSSQTKSWLTWGGIAAVVVFIGFFFYNQIISIPEAEKEKPVDTALTNDWVEGSKEAEVVLVEYSDFQCPACKLYSPVVNQLHETYGDQLAIVYRHFPLSQIHLQAELAAQAAEAAGLQGKFWEMHDMLFEHQDDWAENRNARNLFIDYAKQLGLDEGQFKKDLGSKEVKALVKADYLSGVQLQLNSTPSFFLNGEKIDNPAGIEPFKELIDNHLQGATASATVNE